MAKAEVKCKTIDYVFYNGYNYSEVIDFVPRHLLVGTTLKTIYLLCKIKGINAYESIVVSQYHYVIKNNENIYSVIDMEDFDKKYNKI